MPAHWRGLSDAVGGGLQDGRPLLFLLLLGMAMQFLGITAPGYYNHDETQWLIRSQELGPPSGRRGLASGAPCSSARSPARRGCCLRAAYTQPRSSCTPQRR